MASLSYIVNWQASLCYVVNPQENKMKTQTSHLPGIKKKPRGSLQETERYLLLRGTAKHGYGHCQRTWEESSEMVQWVKAPAIQT